MAFRKLDQSYAMPDKPIHALERTMCQHDFEGRRVFQHRNGDKWTLGYDNRVIWGFLFEKECRQCLEDLRRVWTGTESVPRYNPQKKPKELQMIAEQLTEQFYEYRRVGFDRRKLQFLADGRIGLGGAGCERYWDVLVDEGRLTLLISSDRTITAKLRLQSDRRWRGRWIRHERMPVIVFPMDNEAEQPSQIRQVSNEKAPKEKRNNTVLLRAPLNGYTGYGLLTCQVVTDL